MTNDELTFIHKKVLDIVNSVWLEHNVKITSIEPNWTSYDYMDGEHKAYCDYITLESIYYDKT